MTTQTSKPNRTPWIIVGALGCFAVCLFAALVGGGILLLRTPGQTGNNVSLTSVPIPPPPGGGGVAPPIGEEGITCLAEQGSMLFATGARGTYGSPAYFVSEDGGLSWRETAESNLPSGSCCSTNTSPWRFWVTADGRVQYRVTAGSAIERSEDAGESWQREVDLTKENWKPRYPPGTPTPFVQSPRVGPLDAIVHRPSGNVVLAMGNRGILVRTTDAQWRWVPVGSYYRGEQPPAPITPQVMQFPSPTPDPPTLIPRATWKVDSLYAFVAAFSPDGKLVATGSRNQGIQIWNALDGKLLRTLEKQKGWVYRLAFSPDGQTLASSDSNVDPVVRSYRVADGLPLRVFSDAGGVLGFSPDGQILATSTIRLWRASDGTSLPTLSGQRGVTSAAFSLDGKLFAAGDAEGTMRLWRVADGTLLWTRKAEGPGGSVPIFAALTSLVFSADGQTLSSTQGNLTLWQWRVADASLLRAVALSGPHACYAFVSAFSPDARIFATAVETERVWLWRVEDGTPLGTLQPGSQVRNLVFSPDGAILASSETDGSVRLWDVRP